MNLIDKFAAGLLSDAELNVFETWRKADPSNQLEYEAIRLLINTPPNVNTLTHLARKKKLEKINSNFKQRIHGPLTVAFISILIPLLASYFLTNNKPLHFQNLELKLVFTELELNRNIRIISPTLPCRFTGSFSAMVPTAIILQTIQSVTRLEITLIADQTYLVSGNCQVQETPTP